MEWSNAAFDVLQMWTKTNQRAWAGWLETMHGIGRTPTPDLRGKIIDTWQDSINHTLNAQSEWMQMWAENLKSIEGAPEAVHQWADKSQEAMVRWKEAQRQLWDQLFDLLKKAGPGTTAVSLEEQGLEVFRTWQESVRELVDNQMRLASGWMGSRAGKADG